MNADSGMQALATITVAACHNSPSLDAFLNGLFCFCSSWLSSAHGYRNTRRNSIRLYTATDTHDITTPALQRSVFYRPDALPAAQPTASKHWRHFAHLANTLLKDEESARGSHVFAYNFAKYSQISNFFHLQTQQETFLNLVINNPTTREICS